MVLHSGVRDNYRSFFIYLITLIIIEFIYVIKGKVLEIRQQAGSSLEDAGYGDVANLCWSVRMLCVVSVPRNAIYRIRGVHGSAPPPEGWTARLEIGQDRESASDLLRLSINVV